MRLADATTMAIRLYAGLCASASVQWVKVTSYTTCGVFHVVRFAASPGSRP